MYLFLLSNPYVQIAFLMPILTADLNSVRSLIKKSLPMSNFANVFVLKEQSKMFSEQMRR